MGHDGRTIMLFVQNPSLMWGWASHLQSLNLDSLHLQIEDKVMMSSCQLHSIDLRITWDVVSQLDVWKVITLTRRAHDPSLRPLLYSFLLSFNHCLLCSSSILLPHHPPFVNQCVDSQALPCAQLDFMTLPHTCQSFVDWWIGDFFRSHHLT